MVDSPVGPIRVAWHEHSPLGPALSALRFGESPSRGDTRAVPEPVTRYLGAYFQGLDEPLEMPLAPGGTAFQRLVWAALMKIPRGMTTTYGQLAADLGRPAAARAVGAANGRNPIAIVIPCHRVVASTGALHGYAYGIDIKAELLRLEGARLA